MQSNHHIEFYNSDTKIAIKVFSVCLLAMLTLFVVKPQKSIGSSTNIAAGGSHTVGLQTDGTVWSWGCNGLGQLGDGTTINSSLQVQVVSFLSPFILQNISAIAAGFSHTVALKTTDRTVWAWGYNSSGQLGDTTIVNKTIPIQVHQGTVVPPTGVPVLYGGLLTNVSAIAAGYAHTVALKTDGTVWCTGSNSDGQLGNGWMPDRQIMIQAKNITGVIAIAAGDYHTVALKSDGTVWTWGQNTSGQLGNGTTINSRIPVQVKDTSSPSGLLTNITAITAGGGSTTPLLGTGGHTVALKDDGTVWAWGYNGSGQLGDGTNTDRLEPVQIAAIPFGFKAIAAGNAHTVALDNNGNVRAWGYNGSGQLGDGTNTDSNTPVLLTGISDVSDISAGYDHTVAMQSDGTVWAWGDNFCGKLGDNTNINSLVPVQSYWIQLLPLCTVVTNPITMATVKKNSAVLNGTVNPNGSPASYYFEYGETINYGYSTSTQYAGAGVTSSVNVTDIITGLTPITPYNFRLVAWNSSGTTYGSNQTFTTLAGGAIPSLSITPNPALGNSGGTVTVNLNLTNVFGTNIAALSTDIDFDPNVLENPSAVIGSSISGKTISSALVDSDTFRVAILDDYNVLGNYTISNGVVAKITLQIKPTVPDGTVTTLTQTALGSDATGYQVEINGTDGTINISNLFKLGDCNNNGTVSIAEVQAAINMFLNINLVQSCCDRNGDGVVDISEVQIIINKFLGLPTP
ncbi:MAG: hypothetical protein HQK70_06190 [Desulfamplus sp.]|nr:hypothetical protein [Desulfamplus sp.]